MSTKGAMRELRHELARALEPAGPSSPDDVFAALCAQLSRRRGRPVVYRLVEFPPETAGGLYVNAALHDVAARTDFRQAEEAAAETFGLELGAALRGWLEGADSAAPRSALARRIHDARGHRQG
ncbi:hypothetical protein ACQEVG_31835 [Streptomyces sp. CA-135486]|uniref:hypothetical protein n=1 Tax=Streptomyces sp. CA-135486 TaxID=3240049 RepID=UPI003D903AB7